MKYDTYRAEMELMLREILRRAEISILKELDNSSEEKPANPFLILVNAIQDETEKAVIYFENAIKKEKARIKGEK